VVADGVKCRKAQGIERGAKVKGLKEQLYQAINIVKSFKQSRGTTTDSLGFIERVKQGSKEHK